MVSELSDSCFSKSFSLLDDIGYTKLSNHNSEALNCDLMFQRENSDSTAFFWWSFVWLIPYQIFFEIPSAGWCWWLFMLVSVSPFPLSLSPLANTYHSLQGLCTLQYTTLVWELSIWQNSVQCNARHCTMLTKTMCNLMQDNMQCNRRQYKIRAAHLTQSEQMTIVLNDRIYWSAQSNAHTSPFPHKF